MPSNKSRLVLVLLSFFLGFLGIDRFYGGRVLLGILKLFLGWDIWQIIDFILALLGMQKDSEGRYISRW
ncbi:TM2 domain [Mycoplasmopsis columboralis]|uniref:TM2 domain n=1 Tax=Mycoplasmopsis columboralis TaxID=171282 RepID=A0A449B6U7_9BACT|nr:NINE protein [Mycoplasmopsis columboralis]VEU76337.1 TM2 domain [Mycoplasmopsis columboralis]